MELKNKLTATKPWGKFEQFTLNENTTVKILSADPNSSLSLQYHNQRDEFWRILSGAGEVIIGDEKHVAKTGDEFFIPRKTKHRMMTSDSPIQWLEICFGEFDENDIVRLEDKYDRK